LKEKEKNKKGKRLRLSGKKWSKRSKEEPKRLNWLRKEPSKRKRRKQLQRKRQKRKSSKEK